MSYKGSAGHGSYEAKTRFGAGIPSVRLKVNMTSLAFRLKTVYFVRRSQQFRDSCVSEPDRFEALARCSAHLIAKEFGRRELSMA
jgi:hypothetical protein